MKEQYEKPRITRQVGGVTNKFGTPGRAQVLTEIDGISIEELKSQFGSPLFVYSEKTLKKKYRDLMTAFELRYPRVRHAWSYKTNYLKAICSSFHKLGSLAEVVSSMEYEMAIKLGMAPSQIVFNGPVKQYPHLKRALEDGAIVNVDGPEELEDVIRISEELGHNVKIGLRFNMSLGSHMSWDRYGFNLESGAAADAIRKVASAPNVSLVGYHVHIGTFVYDPDHYRAMIVKLIECHRMARAEFGVCLEYIDIGGGFASKNRLKGLYLSTMDMVPSFDRYAEAICEPLLEFFDSDELPLLIIESGRAMIDEAGSLITTVEAVKRMNDGKRGLVVDSGVNLLFTSFWYDHEVIPTVDRGATTEDHVIYGCLCMQIDVVRDSVKLPCLEKNDSLVVRNIGAYNNTQWLQFIALRPNVVMISDLGKTCVIRQSETVDYLQQCEKLPQWLND